MARADACAADARHVRNIGTRAALRLRPHSHLPAPGLTAPLALFGRYAWLSLDWIDGGGVQRPGAPFKPFDSTTIYYPHELRWEVEGQDTDSQGQAKLKVAPLEMIKMGVR